MELNHYFIDKDGVVYVKKYQNGPQATKTSGSEIDRKNFDDKDKDYPESSVCNNQDNSSFLE